MTDKEIKFQMHAKEKQRVMMVSGASSNSKSLIKSCIPEYSD